MKINIYCENSYKLQIPFLTDEVEFFAEKFFLYALNNRIITFIDEEKTYSFEILLCDNEFIHGINREYRNIDRATDVITFALYIDDENKISDVPEINLGQILISIDKVVSQAKENNVSVKHEFLNLLAHGVLHLLGVDHPTEEELLKMLDLQDKMISEAGYVEV